MGSALKVNPGKAESVFSQGDLIFFSPRENKGNSLFSF